MAHRVAGATPQSSPKNESGRNEVDTSWKGFLLFAVVPVCFFQCGLLFSHSTWPARFHPRHVSIGKNRKVTAECDLFD